jgi:hypothetical protein
MNIKVDDNIIQQTTKCRKNFSCLSGETPFVVLNSVLTIKYILLNVSVINHAVIESLLGTHMYAPAQIKFEYAN